MKAIYEPKGKAGEYAKLACNLYRGCGHGCSYCYAPGVLRMDRAEFHSNPQPRAGIIEALHRDAKRIGDVYKSRLEEYEQWYEDVQAVGVSGCGSVSYSPPPERPFVFLCFTTDPYQPINKEHQLARQAIEILHANDLGVNILTKGVITDFDLLGKRPGLSRVGITLTSTHEATSREWEREAATPNLRMRNLQDAFDLGIYTWMSLEPVINPRSALDVIRWSHSIVKEYKLGKWNYDARAKEIDWAKFANDAVELLEKLGCNYVIKEDLKKYLK